MGKKANNSSKSKSNKFEYPMCVRHLKMRKDVKLRHFFLCNSCTNKWVREAFDGNKPLYCGDSIKGYCLLCNRERQVRLRTWYLCDICDRVARSIGRNHVAEKAIIDYWNSNVLPRFPYFEIKQNDISSLRPRRDTDVSGKGPLDFLVLDDRTGKIALGIENKTGRSSIREMSQFQLDVSDCDSILSHVKELDIPAYIIHAQVLEMWKPPTLGFKCYGLWWSDIYRMTDNFTSIRMRRDERRGAAFFRRSAFEDISTFVTELCDEKSNMRLLEKFKKEGIPSMYKLEES